MHLTAKDLKKELKAYTFQSLTEGCDEVALRSLQKAYVWLETKLIPLNLFLEDTNESVRQIILKRALYELFSYAGNHELAIDKKEDAMELGRSFYGQGFDGLGYTMGEKPNTGIGSALVNPK